MFTIKINKIVIDSKRIYNLYEIYRDDLFETGEININTRKSRSQRIILSDNMTNKYLKAKLVPDKHRIGRFKYAVKGENIITWLANKDDRKLLASKPTKR